VRFLVRVPPPTPRPLSVVRLWRVVAGPNVRPSIRRPSRFVRVCVLYGCVAAAAARPRLVTTMYILQAENNINTIPI
jgi:hypothetical protein